MARQSHTAQILLGAYKTYGVNLADYVYLAADTVNDEETTLSGREIVLVQNTTGGALTCTFTSVASPLNRTGDITAYSVGANEFAMFGPFEITGWQQTDGKLYFSGSAVGLEFAVIRLPTGF